LKKNTFLSPFSKKEFILLELQMKKAVQGFADLNSLTTEHHAGNFFSRRPTDD
jgi:hypothetical protein